MLSAIPTFYNGFSYRSRLEARYALFFNEIKQEYDPEPGNFLVPIGNGATINYMPDFILLNVKSTIAHFPSEVYVEVKGVDSYDQIKSIECRKIEGFSEIHPILVVGSMPNSAEEAIDKHRNDKLWNTVFIDGQFMPCFFTICNGVPWLVDGYRALQNSEKVNAALSIAKYAYFNETQKTQPAEDWNTPPF